jgi:glycosyltransferase involved in cell wall biosynthesis
VSVVSVVTPFYNTAAYLAEAIESVLAQTFGDFELVLRDNASTDGSRDIATQYAAKDKRIKLHRGETLVPQVPNYNAAMRLIDASSRWVKVVQADDLVYPHCLEEMVALGEAHPNVGLVGSYFHHGNVQPERMPHVATVLSGRDARRKQLLERVFLFGSPTTTLVRADIVRSRNPFYTEGRMHEDTEVCFEILRTHDFGFVPQVASYIRLDNQSIMGSADSFAPGLLDRLINIRTYGREFLDEDEYRRVLADHERDYRNLLGRAWLLRREKKFWDYHRRGLATIGDTIDRTMLARGAAEAVLGYARRKA